ncbi:MAG: hypothetical protein EOP20_00385 [Hyphomicrobiales bacterium]|nr:MAG: hypothetical protein EOP20_00385 [Hyphomicrobiales bacterium]
MLDNLFRGAFCGLIVAGWLATMLLAGIFIGEYQFMAKAEYGKIAVILLLAIFFTLKLINLLGLVWSATAKA